MKTLNALILSFFLLYLTSCSSLNKSMLYSSLGAATLGGFAGSALSPNKESRMSNAVLFGSIGAVGGALLGRYFFNENPENQKMPSMILDEPNEDSRHLELIPKGSAGNLSPITINATPIKKYDLPLAPMPEELKAKAKKQYAIEYLVEGKVIEQGNSSFYIKPTTVIEYKVE